MRGLSQPREIAAFGAATANLRGIQRASRAGGRITIQRIIRTWA